MKHASSLLVSIAGGLLLLNLNGFVSAQTSAQAAASTARPEQTIQRIRTEDAGSRIDEVRVGGVTQSIVVQPKTGADLPAYEVRPSSNPGAAAPANSKSDTVGARVWNVLKF